MPFMRRLAFLCLVLIFQSFASLAPAGVFDELSKRDDLILVSPSASVAIELRYATKNNFMGEVLYGDLNQVYLHRQAYAKLTRAAEALQAVKPGWKLLVFDGLRPRSVQERMWAKVSGTAQSIYVADPKKGSVHNFGMAVDLSLMDDTGKEVDMGTPFDSFEKVAQPRYEDQYLKEGRLTQSQVDRRHLLRKIMTDAGFLPIPNEWWHFDGLPQAVVRAQFKIVEGR